MQLTFWIDLFPRGLVENRMTTTTKTLGVSLQAFSAILSGRSGITADMALRLSSALGTSADLQLGMQMQFDLWQEKQKTPEGVQHLAA